MMNKIYKKRLKGRKSVEQQINVIVIQDDNDINQLMCSLIKNNNYFTHPAYSGTEALIYLDKKNRDLELFNLIITSREWEVILEKITSKYSIPVIIISAKSEQQTKVKGLRSGADDFISKPFDVEEVSARIDSLLRRYKRAIEAPKRNQVVHKDIQLDLDAKM